MEDFDDDEIDGLIGKQPVHSPPGAKDVGTMKRTTLQLRKKWTGLEGLLAEPPPTSWIHSEVYEQLSQENQVSPPLNDVLYSISIDAIVCTYVQYHYSVKNLLYVNSYLCVCCTQTLFRYYSAKVHPLACAYTCTVEPA